MLFLDIIDWCNKNQGFIGALLSLLTLIVSIIAIIISVITARKEYEELYKKGAIVPSGDCVIKLLKEKELDDEK